MKKKRTDRGKKADREKLVRFEGGKMYFSKEGERFFFFWLTMIMLILGIFYKTGLIK